MTPTLAAIALAAVSIAAAGIALAHLVLELRRHVQALAERVAQAETRLAIAEGRAKAVEKVHDLWIRHAVATEARTESTITALRDEIVRLDNRTRAPTPTKRTAK